MNCSAKKQHRPKPERPTFPERAVITAGMPYGNKNLHFGHIGGVFVHADIFARFLRDRIGAENVLFVSGTDCYGSSIVEEYRLATGERGFTGTIGEFVRENHKLQVASLDAFDISLDLFAASALDGPAEVHRDVCADLMRKLHEHGHLTKRDSLQFYDEQANMFLNGRQVEGKCPIEGCGSDKGYADECSLGHQYEPQDLENPLSTISGTVPVMRTVSNWYVNVPSFQSLLGDWLQDMGGKPYARPFAVKAIGEFLEPPIVFVFETDMPQAKETLAAKTTYSIRESKSKSVALVFESLDDREKACELLAKSGIRFRTGKTLVPFRLTGNQEWGLPAPQLEGEDERTWWVWPESLIAPISFTAFCCERDGKDRGEWTKWWCDKKAGVFQFIGEDNVYFYGPAEMAMFLGLQGKSPTFPPPPDTMQLPSLVVNKHVQFLNKKISSSSEIKPPLARELLSHYTSDQLRAHFFGLGLGKQSVSFQPKAMNPEANPKEGDPVLDEGNLLSNVFNRAARSCFYTVQKHFEGRLPNGEVSEAVVQESEQTILTYEANMAMHRFHMVMATMNKYIRGISKFWAKNSQGSGENEIDPQALIDLFHYVRTAAVLMHPIAPKGTELIREYFNVGEELWSWDRITEPLTAFMSDPAAHEFKHVPPRFDFFEKHESQVRSPQG